MPKLRKGSLALKKDKVGLPILMGLTFPLKRKEELENKGKPF